MEQRGRALVLVGFMGTGKSSVGRAIARRLRLPRHDTDQLVMERLGLPVAEIFERLGEAKFRDVESEVLHELNRDVEAIIVTGGGVVLRQENVAQLQRLGFVVRLTADEETLFERVSRRATRPLLRTENPRRTLGGLLASRDRFYEAAADATVDTSRLSHDEVADEVIRLWNAAVVAPTYER